MSCENVIGFVKPTYPNEKRVSLLPVDIIDGESLIIEKGFGESLDIADEDYMAKGCKVVSRSEVFNSCRKIFSLKLLQPSDYDLIKQGQIIIGWTHPTGSGLDFMEKVAKPKNLRIYDIDNIYPTLYHNESTYPIEFLPKNFIIKNSFYAGFSAVSHALMSFGMIPNSNHQVAVLSPGNVSQGALKALNNFGADIRVFYRNTMQDFIESISQFDIIVNGIEIFPGESPIINKETAEFKLKAGALIIDAAADAGGAIESGFFTSHEKPIVKFHKGYYYCVNNAPSFYYREASEYISSVVKQHILPNSRLFK